MAKKDFEVPIHIPKSMEKHRLRLADPELQFIFVAVLNKLVKVNKAISEYEGLKADYEKDREYVEEFPEPRREKHERFDRLVARLRGLESEIQTRKLRFLLRLYRKVYKTLGEPPLKPEYRLVEGDVAEWIHHPFFVELPNGSEQS